MHPILQKIYNGWMKFARAIGYVNTRIILVLVFYIAVTPTALLAKAVGKDFMSRKKKESSYWRDTEIRTEKEAYLKPY